ncbi:peptidylprolyl isomerase [Nostoc sp. FACHB-280]|uniref:peptidylprolyl isomerase n=1 Tax=Nostoc sp. FACHB-280 TaxID=2692839 RepID=UPI00168AC470|nr:peptidylprolyl isomerase [Nostoc sp. FACHB-280]MBD2497912.1 peptidylprolyl isomerase [Nostoc sp. FACHB-280]
MNTALQLGDAIAPPNIIPLLASYNLMPQFLCESIIDAAIASISCTQAEINHALEQFYQHWDLKTDKKIQDWCLRYGFHHQQVKILATRKLRIEKFKQATWGNQLESYFLQRKRQLDKVIYSLIRIENRGTANELFFRIAEGEQVFAELAKEYSQGLEADTGGIIGPVEFGSITPNFAQLLYTSQVGVVQSPVPWGNLWVIVRVEKIIPAQLDDFMRQRLLQENFEAWLQQQISQLSPEEKLWMGVGLSHAETHTSTSLSNQRRGE